MGDTEFLKRGAKVQMKRSWWPRSCKISGKLLWLTQAYCATRVWTGPGDAIFEHRWYSCKEFIILRLKG